MKILAPIAALFLLAAATDPGRAQEPGPEQLVQRITDEVMTAIRADRAIVGDRDKALKLAEQKVLPYVDFEEATRLAVSRAWLQASTEQKAKLIAEFRAMLLRTYVNAVGAYAGTQPRLLPSRGSAYAAEATVRYQLARSGGRPVQVAYEMRRTGAGWKIYDVSVEGMSLVLTYRTEFDGILKQEGIDGLISRLAQKNAPPKLAL